MEYVSFNDFETYIAIPIKMCIECEIDLNRNDIR